MEKKKYGKALTSELILRQTCLRCAIELCGPKSKLEAVLKTADDMVAWVKK